MYSRHLITTNANSIVSFRTNRFDYTDAHLDMCIECRITDMECVDDECEYVHHYWWRGRRWWRGIRWRRHSRILHLQ
jgi:hypothetical protein